MNNLPSLPVLQPTPAGTPEPGADGPQGEGRTVLCVDDEPSIVSALRRLFRTSGYRVVTALSGAEALALLEREPVDLVFSDMRMPGMDGAQLLEQVHTRWPNTARVLLTGYADMRSTIAAINSGQVYRYITKPWADEEILATARQVFERQALEREKHRLEALTQAQNQELASLNASLEQKVAERTRELSQLNQKLKKNYLTSIKVFSNLMELRGGQLMGHARRGADLARQTARAMGMPETEQQDVFVAGLLHDIGFIGLSDNILALPVPRLAEEDLSRYRKHPILGEQALLSLDDMHSVATLIRGHHERHDGKGFPDGLAGAAIPLGARILAVADAFDDLQSGHLGSMGLSPAEARTLIARGRGNQFDPEVVDVFLQVVLQSAPVDEEPPVMTGTDGLRPGMVLARDLRSSEGVMLLATGHVLTADLIRLLRQRAQRDGVDLVLPIKRQRRT
jgi:response regulator RpfG family c-di-GMP phosphodiesterase